MASSGIQRQLGLHVVRVRHFTAEAAVLGRRSMDKYIEVVGEAKVSASVDRFRAALTFTVRAASHETALNESLELRNGVIKSLKASGITDDEMSEGGGATWTPWFWRKKPGQESSHRVLLNVRSRATLQKAVADLEPLFESKRFTFDFNEMGSTTKMHDDDVAKAREEAVESARTHANQLAGAAGVQLGAIVRIEELTPHQSRSGAYGDEEWRGVAVAGAAAASADFAEPIELSGPGKGFTHRYKVWFEIS